MSNRNHSSPPRSATFPFGVVGAVVVGLACLAAVVALVRVDHWGDDGNGLPKSIQYDLAAYQKTDPALIGYEQTARVPLSLTEPRAVAVGPEDQIYVAGDQAIHVYSAGGGRVKQIALDGRVQALAVGGPEHEHPGRIYAGLGGRVDVLDAQGKRVASWAPAGEKSLVTSIAAGEHDVFVADAGLRAVRRYDLDGKLLARIGDADPAHGFRGFFIPSPHFDLAMAPDGLLRVVNPAMHRVEAFTADGHLELSWGKATLAIDGFCGCCNPANIAVTPDGNIVTAEKGIPRVKVYTPEGKLVWVVAGPELLAPHVTSTAETRDELKLKVVDVAADSRGRVLVLDPAARSVRVFELKAEAKGKP